MIIKLINNDFSFDIANTVLLFYPRISTVDGNDGKEITVSLNENSAIAEYSENNYVYFSETYFNRELYDFQRCACVRSVFDVCYKATGIRPPWGLLIGVRPINFYLKMQTLYGDKCEEILESSYIVSRDKIRLCAETVEMRSSSVAKLMNDSFSLYVSVPFCPSRCKYCSFVSYSTENETKYIENYVEILCTEIKNTALQLERKAPLTVYIGGGTPTCIADHLFQRILNCITESFDLSECFEFTVEAGRPETISETKLQIMKKYGVNRICINPQSLSDDVLLAVGRKHSVEDFFNAYDLAGSFGFDINVDLIAGLPLETANSFADGLKKIINLSPSNITIHSLYIKRAADYGADCSLYAASKPEIVNEMLSCAVYLMHDNGYYPYYLYRQKNTIGNNENIGFSKKGKECAYNIYMMDELQTIYGCGANAMTKIINNGIITRSCGTKYAYNYIKNNGEKNK
ncbi:MAG: coproporphyrinogen dehydrogenase HemZ [Clostridia bacterium]|nr:coproporphyrinogen dehydrogenase HemZ [Clostridia bacterium]